MGFGNVIRKYGGIVLPNGLSLSEEVGNDGCTVVSVVSSGSVVVHNDKVLGEVFSYGVPKIKARQKGLAARKTSQLSKMRRKN